MVIVMVKINKQLERCEKENPLNNEKTSTDILNFEPPKLPFKWLATTFIAPVIVAVLPNIITEQGISLEHRLIAALILFSVMLLVSCIIIMLKSYDRSYEIQTLKMNHHLLTEEFSGKFEKLKEQFALKEAQDQVVRSIISATSEINRTLSDGADPKLIEAVEALKLSSKLLEETLMRQRQ